jgi:hypothetical protein
LETRRILEHNPSGKHSGALVRWERDTKEKMGMKIPPPETDLSDGKRDTKNEKNLLFSEGLRHNRQRACARGDAT